MTHESVVYGCIRDQVFTRDAAIVHRRRQANRDVLSSLPSAGEWPLIAREMFALPPVGVIIDGPHTDVIAFGSAYRGIEYEWERWIESFEAVLARMYWVSASVHLETELSGVHSFTWDADGLCHEPGTAPLAVRCEWTRERMAL